MKTEFKRVQEEIETLKYFESHKELTEHGKQKLIELETLMDYAHSCAQLKENENLKFEEFMNNFCKNGITLTNNYTGETIGFKELVKKYKMINNISL